MGMEQRHVRCGSDSETADSETANPMTGERAVPWWVWQ